jgi:hypothetical protein
MPFDYETPPPPPDPLARRKRWRRAIAVTLLIGGLFFGLAETVVFVMGMLAVGSFGDMRHEGLDARFEELVPVIMVALGGFGLAAVGYFLDPVRGQPRERGDAEASPGHENTST